LAAQLIIHANVGRNLVKSALIDRNYQIQMKNIILKSISYIFIGSSLLFTSCIAPRKLLKDLKKDPVKFRSICEIIKAENSNNSNIKTLADIHNEQLKDILKCYSISSFKIQYSTDDALDIKSDFRDTRYDSTILFSWDKPNINRDYILYNLVYSFCKNQLNTKLDTNEKRINDSIWLEKHKIYFVVIND
jgi:hypothetical protein